MKKQILCIATSVFLFPAIFCQDVSLEFGKFSQEEIAMTTFTRDPQAEAVILYDIGESKFVDTRNGYDIEFSRTKRIKVLTRAGIKYSEISIPLYTGSDGQTETLKTLVAMSYNFENGQMKRTDLNPSSVYEERLNNRWKLKKFVFPDVKPGTIMEYLYIMTSPYHFNLPDWEFQARIPTVYSKYTVRMIPFYEYAFIANGTTKFDIQSSTVDKTVRTFGSVDEVMGQQVGTGVKFQDMVHVYGMRNVPAFRDEAYITSVDDYLIKMDFQLAKFNNPYGPKEEIISTWPKLIEGLLRSDEFGKYIKAGEKNAEKALSGIRLTEAGETSKAREIINYVKSSYKWDGFTSIYASKTAKDFAAQKTGNSTDINLYLVAMLRAAGISADPVISSTRSNGRINTQYPFLHYFNYVIVLVNTAEGKFLCDGTDTYTRFDKIPTRCINDRGLIISNNGENWVALNTSAISSDVKSLLLEPDPQTLKAKVQMHLQATEFDGSYYRRNFEDDTIKIRKYLEETGFTSVAKTSTFNFANNEKPYIISCSAETAIEQIDNKIIVSPFMSFYQAENRLTQQTRTYPIDFTYVNTESFKCRIKIPAGYKVMNLPENYNVDNEIVKIFSSWKSDGEVLEIDCSYGFKKSVYPPANYNEIKVYFDIIVRKFHEQVVLEKAS